MNHARTDAADPTRALRLFVGVAIILLPFNALPYFRNIFGELAYEGAFYPLLIGVVWWAAALGTHASVVLPRHMSARLLLAFVVWVFLSGLVNAPALIDAETKGRTGIEKFLLQSVLVLFTLVSTILIYNAFVRCQAVLRRVRFWMLVSFIVCGAYSILEIGKLVGVGAYADILALLDSVIRDPENVLAYHDFGRLRSVSGEASWFAMYCALVTPWILSYVYTQSRTRWLCLLVVMYLAVLITLTWSRTAYVITALQVSLFVVGAAQLGPEVPLRAGRRAVAIALILVFGIAGVSTVSVFEEKVFIDRSLLDVFASLLDTEHLSNLGRMGSQVAAVRIALDSPMFGVGLGQYGFHMASYTPSWALASAEVGAWMSSSPDAPWAPVQGLHSRIAAELGFVGLALWAAMWVSIIRAVYVRLKRASEEPKAEKLAGLALLVSLAGVLLCGFNADSFRFFGYWIALALAWAYLERSGQSEAGTT